MCARGSGRAASARDCFSVVCEPTLKVGWASSFFRGGTHGNNDGCAAVQAHAQATARVNGGREVVFCWWPWVRVSVGDVLRVVGRCVVVGRDSGSRLRSGSWRLLGCVVRRVALWVGLGVGALVGGTVGRVSLSVGISVGFWDVVAGSCVRFVVAAS